MNFRELRACTKRTLKGRYFRVLRASLLYPAAWLFFRLCPCILAGILILHDRLTPKALFFGGIPFWTAFSVLWAILRFFVLLPLQCGTCSWFTELLGLARCRRRTFFCTSRAFFRGAGYFLCVELSRLLAVLPLALGLFGADAAFCAAADLPEGGPALFLTAQCLCIAAAGAVYYLCFCTGLAAVPFLFAEAPDSSPFADIRRSRTILRGHHIQLFRLILGYLPAALPVVTIPFLLPCLITDLTLFLQICIREQEKEEYAHTAISCAAHGAVQT